MKKINLILTVLAFVGLININLFATESSEEPKNFRKHEACQIKNPDGSIKKYGNYCEYSLEGKCDKNPC